MASAITYGGDMSLQFRSNYIVYENMVKCTIKNYEFNYSLNPTLLQSGSAQNVQNFATSSDFHPYITGVGLFDDNNNLLMVAKTGRPIPMPSETDLNILVRWDQ